MNRRSFLRTAGAGSAWIAGTSAGFRASAAPGAAAVSEDELLAQARERITKHRMAEGQVVVVDRQARPVADATVAIEQLRHEFLFGCNGFLFGRVGDPEGEEAYRTRFAAVMNFATLGFYWATYERERGKANHAAIERVLEWTAKQGIRCKGHPLVWDHPAGSPDWLPDDFDQIKALSDGRVRDLVQRFRGRLDTWDVVNEATHLPDHANKTRMAAWGARLGSAIYTREALLRARQAHPPATLLVNDYRTDPPYYRLLDGLRDNGGRLLFDVVGIQSHMHDGRWPLSRIWEVCDTYARLRRPIHFTETTLVSGPRLGPGENWGPTDAAGEARQAEDLEKVYTMLFGHPQVQAITWWDLSDRGAWQKAAAGLLRADLSPKPAYERLQSLVKGAWWTRATGRTNARGELPVQAFLGRHRITVTPAEGDPVTRDVDWRAGQRNRYEFKVG
jgi:endo-1,4-beta-xylanase